MTGPKRSQIVGRIAAELSRRVRAAAKRQKVSLNAFLTEALTRAVPTSQNGA